MLQRTYYYEVGPMAFVLVHRTTRKSSILEDIHQPGRYSRVTAEPSVMYFYRQEHSATVTLHSRGPPFVATPHSLQGWVKPAKGLIYPSVHERDHRD